MYLAPAVAALQMTGLLYNLKNMPRTLRRAQAFEGVYDRHTITEYSEIFNVPVPSL
jgi:hypothetical protein